VAERDNIRECKINTEKPKSVDMRPSPNSIRALPKADLHSHIDGSVSARELFQIAKRNRRRILAPNGDELDNVTALMRYIRGDGYDSLLESIVDRFYPITGLMQTEETIRDVGVSYVKEQRKDGVAYAEGRFAPQYHTREGLSLKDVIASMADGLAEGAEKYEVKTALIVAIGRETSSRIGGEVARAASGSGSVVALDLGGPEAGNPPQKFKDAFKTAIASGLNVTVHAGEGAGSLRQNLANIEAAILQLGANRLGHAINLAQDGHLMSLVRDRSIVIETNPISNMVLQKIRDLKELAIDRLLSKSIRVTVNSDDPAIWPQGSLSNVYASVCKAYGFGMKELDALVENSFRGAFAKDRRKEELVERYRVARKRYA
jgi:adenosine deaminase